MDECDLVYASVGDMARAVRSRRVSALELTERHLERIEAVNPVLNAVVCATADAALEQARQADAATARGEEIGPLHGVPMTIKDSLETSGIASTCGTLGLRGHIPKRDAEVVTRLKSAGTILLGKTNTPELTLAFETDNRIYGRTNNPYAVDRSSGGSSGGAAAIVASGGAAFDIGSDTGGSIRLPAHFCGVTGIRPTSGRVPRTGHLYPPGGYRDAWTVLGPIARKVEDLALLLPILCGPDWRDPAVVPMPLGDPGEVLVGGLRVAVHTNNGIMAADRDTVDTVRAAAAALENAGAQVVEVRPPAIEHTDHLVGGLWAADGDTGVRGLLERYGTDDPHHWLANLCERELEWEPTGADLALLLERQDQFRSLLLGFMEQWDLILCPVCAFPACPHDTWQEPDRWPGFSYTITYNVTGWPAVVVRCGTSGDGLPIGVQLVARPWREDVALAAAAYLEAVFGGWQPPAI